MPSIESMRAEVRRLRALVPLPTDPKRWCFMLEDGSEIPDRVREQIGPQDEVYIRLYPRGLFGDEQRTGQFEPAIGHYTTIKGKCVSFYASGRTEEIRVDRHRNSRRF